MVKEKTGDIKAAYELRDSHGADAVIAHYASWADSYDRDTASYGYVGPKSAACALARFVQPSDVRVLDIGCGTGLAGEELARLGFVRMDGTDISPQMLDVASAKAVYERLFAGDVLEGLDCPDAAYDALITVGTFGPVGPQGFRECLRVLRPGGIACISINEIFVDEQDFHGEMDRLVKSGVAELCERDRHPHLTEGGHEAYISVLRKTAGSG